MSPDLKPPRLGRSLVLKAALAGLVICLATAGAVSATVLLQVDEIITILKREGQTAFEIPEIDRADAGGPQTIMVLGSDIRYGDEEAGLKPRSDTILLVRLDPNKEVIAMTSIPRDLLVEVEGVGDSVKINSAYEAGGERLTLKTVKNLLSVGGRDFKINHVITVDFSGFRRAIDYIGCVYTDIDRDYFNDNTGPGGYAAIDINPGYQKVCGADALAYVRYRHTDNDLVRAARQQDFLRQVRTAQGTRELLAGGISLGNLKKLARVFARYFSPDKTLQETQEVFKFAKTVLFTARNPVREVRFRVSSAPDQINLVASEDQLESTVHEFLDAKASDVPREAAEPTEEQAEAQAEEERESDRERDPSSVPGLEDARAEGEDLAILNARKAKFPFFFPGLKHAGSTYDEPRVYGIKDEEGNKHKAYRLVLEKANSFGEYYGVQGLEWRDPPILNDPHETIERDGEKLMVFRDGKRIRLVAMRKKEAVYWVSNTLTRSLSNAQMLAIAGSLRKLGGGGGS